MSFGLQTFNEFGDATFDSTKPILHLGETLITIPKMTGGHEQFYTVTLPDEVPHWVSLEQLRVIVVPTTGPNYDFFEGVFPVIPVSLTGRTVTLRREGVMEDNSYYQPNTIRFCWISSL